MIELGLMEKPKKFSILDSNKLLVKYSFDLTSTINKLLSNFLTIKGAARVAETTMNHNVINLLSEKRIVKFIDPKFQPI